MKRIIFGVLAGLATATTVQAQTYTTLPNDQLIARALSAAPAAARESAMVVKWAADGSYATIKEGTGALVCYDHSGGAGEQPFAVQCTNPGNLPRVQQNYRLEAQAAGNRDQLRTLLQTAEGNGTRVRPEFGSVWISMTGADQASARTHTTIAVPGATMASLGLPENRNAGGGWIMDAGTTSAHIMVPGQ
ncbi:MAG: hypothetical protein ABL963_01605 [Longimicrobiales bacterium]